MSYWYLVWALLVLGILGGALLVAMASALRSVGATIGRAKRAHSTIQAGMTADQVHEILDQVNHGSSGYYLCHYSSGTKEEFLTKMRDGGAPGTMRVHMMGQTPYRVSFTVAFDASGHVSEVSSTKGWD